MVNGWTGEGGGVTRLVDGGGAVAAVGGGWSGLDVQMHDVCLCSCCAAAGVATGKDTARDVRMRAQSAHSTRRRAACRRPLAERCRMVGFMLDVRLLQQPATRSPPATRQLPRFGRIAARLSARKRAVRDLPPAFPNSPGDQLPRLASLRHTALLIGSLAPASRRQQASQATGSAAQDPQHPSPPPAAQWLTRGAPAPCCCCWRHAWLWAQLTSQRRACCSRGRRGTASHRRWTASATTSGPSPTSCSPSAAAAAPTAAAATPACPPRCVRVAFRGAAGSLRPDCLRRGGSRSSAWRAQLQQPLPTAARCGCADASVSLAACLAAQVEFAQDFSVSYRGTYKVRRRIGQPQ